MITGNKTLQEMIEILTDVKVGNNQIKVFLEVNMITLKDLNLIWADLSGENLKGANLKGADISEINFGRRQALEIKRRLENGEFE